MDGLLVRTKKNDTQTIGNLYIFDGIHEVFKCATLELSDKYNQKNISCIPEGNYKVVKRWSEKFKNHFHIINVKNRSYILIHSGNFYFDIEGCILVGKYHSDINNDGHLDVVHSRTTMNELLNIIKDESFNLKIVTI